jgi:hypothetical protein
MAEYIAKGDHHFHHLTAGYVSVSRGVTLFVKHRTGTT